MWFLSLELIRKNMSYENNCLVKRLSHSFHPLYFQIRYLGKRYVFNSWHHFPRVLFFCVVPLLKTETAHCICPFVKDPRWPIGGTPKKTVQTKLVATFWQGCWNTLSDPSCQQQLPYLFLPLLGLSAWFCTTCWCSVMVPWHWEPNNFFIAHVGILGKYVLVLHFCIGETQIGETNGTNTELLKSPMQALLTRAAGVEKNMQNAWVGRGITFWTRVHQLTSTGT